MSTSFCGRVLRGKRDRRAIHAVTPPFTAATREWGRERRSEEERERGREGEGAIMLSRARLRAGTQLTKRRRTKLYREESALVGNVGGRYRQYRLQIKSGEKSVTYTGRQAGNGTETETETDRPSPKRS